MTNENRQRNARDELERAATCLREARALAQASLPYGAASRAYYCVFDAARALLFSAGLEAPAPRSVPAPSSATIREFHVPVHQRSHLHRTTAVRPSGMPIAESR